jgi:hypothetical protein
MGMPDEIRCELEVASQGIRPGARFQTRSLFREAEVLTITRDRRLVLHRCRLELEPDVEPRPGARVPRFRRVLGENLDLEYHGDLWLFALDDDSLHERYVARFTHGQLEWIRPFAELSEAQRWVHQGRN